MELYLVRHGETIWNQEGRYYGHSDVGLSPAGIFQAQTLGKYFRQIEFDEIYISPLKRAVDTVKECVSEEAFSEKIIRDPRLMEQNFGLFEGKTYSQLKEEYPAELALWNKDWQEYCLPDGESFHDVRTRVEDFSLDLWEQERISEEKNRSLTGKRASKKILIGAHKGTFGHLLAALLHMPLSGYWNFVFEQGTYSRIDIEDGYAIIRCLNALPKQINF